MLGLGCIKSELDGTEHIYETPQTIDIPKEYSYMNNLPKVLNQGNNPFCVPCSLSSYINWKINLVDGIIKDNEVNLNEIFNNRLNFENDEGMMIKDGLTYLKKQGVNTKDGIFKINRYAKVTNLIALRFAILMNGPCIGALPVYNYGDGFWRKNYNDVLIGCHAVSIVGYDHDGFIIRNSWGKSYGKNGYFYIKNEEINNFIELWTIIL